MIAALARRRHSVIFGLPADRQGPSLAASGDDARLDRPQSSGASQIDAVEPRHELAHRNRAVRQPRRVGEAAALEPLVTQFEMQAFPSLRRTLSASLTRSTRSADGSSPA